MNTEEKESLVLRLFSNKVFFQKKILDVKSSKDKIEIINILVPKIIRETLKNELNFLYMKDFNAFKLSLIVNILFKEVASEWLIFSNEVLGYSREKALEEIKNKERVAFIYAIVEDYFFEYKNYFLDEIVDTFLELVEISIGTSSKNKLIEFVLTSPVINLCAVSTISNVVQLKSRVTSARNFKGAALSILQIKIAEISNTIEYGELGHEEKEKVLSSLIRLQKEKKALETKSLDNFDEALKRFKKTMIKAVSSMKIT